MWEYGAVSDETHLSGGSMNEVKLVGRTVRRQTGPWTPAVHDLLNFLNAEGLSGIPKVHGVDDEGFEILEYVEGRGVPVDDEVVLDNVLVEAVQWLRDYHDLVANYRPPGLVNWRTGEKELGPDQIICHNDPGAYNWIIQSGHFVAMIDWDLAGPGNPIDDLAFLAWTAIPLYRDIGVERTAARLDLLVDAYGEWGPSTLLGAVVDRMTTATERIKAGIERGDVGMLRLAQTGEPQRTIDRIAAFKERIPLIEAALG